MWAATSSWMMAMSPNKHRATVVAAFVCKWFMMYLFSRLSRKMWKIVRRSLNGAKVRCGNYIASISYVDVAFVMISRRKRTDDITNLKLHADRGSTFSTGSCKTMSWVRSRQKRKEGRKRTKDKNGCRGWISVVAYNYLLSLMYACYLQSMEWYIGAWGRSLFLSNRLALRRRQHQHQHPSCCHDEDEDDSSSRKRCY